METGQLVAAPVGIAQSGCPSNLLGAPPTPPSGRASPKPAGKHIGSPGLAETGTPLSGWVTGPATVYRLGWGCFHSTREVGNGGEEKEGGCRGTREGARGPRVLSRQEKGGKPRDRSDPEPQPPPLRVPGTLLTHPPPPSPTPQFPVRAAGVGERPQRGELQPRSRELGSPRRSPRAGTEVPGMHEDSSPDTGNKGHQHPGPRQPQGPGSPTWRDRAGGEGTGGGSTVRGGSLSSVAGLHSHLPGLQNSPYSEGFPEAPGPPQMPSGWHRLFTHVC